MSLLSELCSICYVEKPKYRCPRCKTGTCSLPCYKRHQQRASCNGKRDPAEYLKKSQIATPSGIDRDYNYLKGVEREIDSASRDTYDRGIGSKDVTKSFSRSMHPEGKLQQYLATNRITISRAPKGMTRQKTNRTRRTKRDHVFWTVEWIDQEGRCEVQHDCPESSSLEATYSTRLSEKTNVEHSVDGQSSDRQGAKGKKRKRQDQLDAGNRPEEHRDDIEKSTQAVENVPKPAAPEMETPELETPELKAPDAVEGVSEPKEVENPSERQPEETTSEEKLAEEKLSQDPIPSEKQDSKRKHFFYLLKAGTPSASKVLIPLMPDNSLTETLRDQTVLEYPTYYVLPHSPSQLPTGYTTEHEYLQARKAEEKELAAAIEQAGEGSKLGLSGAKPETAAPVDANKILDMLKRDVTR